jgi:hypothetical protein
MDDEQPPAGLAGGDPALLRDQDDPEALDLGARFRIAFARHCAVADLADSEPCSLTVGQLAELCELMFAVGFDAALEEIGYGR